MSQLLPSSLKKLIKAVVVFFLDLYFRVRRFWPVWFYVLNRRPREFLAKDLPVLDKVQQRVLLELQETGIAVTHLDDLFPGRNMFVKLRGYTDELVKSAQVKTGKTFLKYLFDANPLLDFKNPFVRLSLDEKVLNVVNTYMEMYSKFYYFTLNVTTPVSEGSQAVASQRWHRDPEDRRMLKFFVYLNDVDETGGPFTYIPHSRYGLRWGNIFPGGVTSDFYPPEGGVEKIIPRDVVRVCTGRAGTVIFCDTSGLHKGGYALKKERTMFTAGFRSQASPWRSFFRYPETLSEELKAAHVGASARFAIEKSSGDLSSRLFQLLKVYSGT